MFKKSLIALSLGALVLSAAPDSADAKTLKVQASSKAGDWAHRFMTDKWAPKLDAMTGGEIKLMYYRRKPSCRTAKQSTRSPTVFLMGT